MAARLALAVGPAAGGGWQTDFEEGWLGHGGVGLAWDGRGQGTPRVPHAVPAAGGTRETADVERGGGGHGGNGLWERGSGGRKLSTRTHKRVD